MSKAFCNVCGKYMGSHNFQYSKKICNECKKSIRAIGTHFLFELIDYDERTGRWRKLKS